MVPYRRYHYGDVQQIESSEDENEDLVLPDGGFEGEMMVLPIELVVWIFDIYHFHHNIRPKHLMLLKRVFGALLPLLYHKPVLKATNFFAFVNAVTKHKQFGRQIRELDLSSVVQLGKNAFVAKLLKRLAPLLQLFVAPCTLFGFGPLLALRNCTQLRILDLSLVSEMLDLGELFKLINRLQDLTHLAFPRSLVEIHDYDAITWPPLLAHLHISGGVSDEFLIKLTFPRTITHLEFSNCPQIQDLGLQDLLIKVGHNLQCLTILYPMPGLSANAADIVWSYTPNLKELLLLVEYILGSFFDEDNLVADPDRPLKTLFIRSSGSLGSSGKVDPIDLAIALDDGRLPNLRNIITSAQLGWNNSLEYVLYIGDYLDNLGGALRMSY